MNALKGKVAIITGGSRGIGRAIVRLLAQRGCTVAFNYLHSKDQAFGLQQEVKDLGAKCFAQKADISEFKAVKQWVSDVLKETGRLDILINNAGVISDKPLMMMTEEDWRNVIDINLNGMFNATRACIFNFMKQKSGNIINVSSVSGLMGLAGQTNYSASKGGMNAFTKALAREVAAHNIRVNAICPGFIKTDIIEHMNEEKINEILEVIPLKRIGNVDDVTGCVEFLLSESSQYITGQLFSIDGGLYMH